MSPLDSGVRSAIRARADYPRLVLLTCLGGMFATTFTATILGVSLKVIATDLHTTPATIAWVITAPSLAAAVAMPILGRFGDLYGHRRVFLLGFVFAILFNLLTAVAWNPATLIAFRTVAQLSGTATVPSSLAMLFHAHPPEARVRISSWANSVLAASAVVGLAIGGPMVDWVGWRPLFLIQAGLSLVAIVPAVLILERDQRAEGVRLDRAGAAALGVTVFALAFGVNRAPLWGLDHPAVVASLAALPVGAWSLIRIERRAAAPLLPLDVVRRRNVSFPLMAVFWMMFGYVGSFIVTPILLQTRFGYSTTVTSFISMIRALTTTVVAPVAGRVTSRVGERQTALAAFVAMTGAMAACAAAAGSGSIAVLIVGMIASSVAFNHVTPGALAVISNAVRDDQLGLATSAQQTMMAIGGVVGISVMTGVAADATGKGPFVLAYVIGAVSAVIGAGFAAGMATGRSTDKDVSAPPLDSLEVGLS